MTMYTNRNLFLIGVLASYLALTGCDSSSSDNMNEEGLISEEEVINEGDVINEEEVINEGENSTSATTQNGVITSDGSYDIYDAVFVERSVDCADYANNYEANPMDLQNSTSFNADVFISVTSSECTISSNSVPNHDFNDDSAAFAGGQEGATITPQEDFSHTIARAPSFAAEPTFITQQIKNGIFLNGVQLDIMSAGCYRPTDEQADEFGEVGIGCNSDEAWILDPLSTESKFGADLHNAHTQPGGLYHYHGSPLAMYDDNPGPEGSPVIGFAADGFPIYGPYFLDDSTGTVRKALSGYTLKTGSRGERSDTNPGGEYTGRYNDDWEFTNAGDLDECNGMSVGGQYGYYVADTYPWVIKCLMGTPGDSFVQAAGGPPPQDGSDNAAQSHSHAH